MISVFSFVAMILAAVGGMTYSTLLKTRQAYARIISLNLPNLVAVSDMRTMIRKIELAYALLGLATSEADVASARELLESSRAKYIAADQAYLKIPFVCPGEKELYLAQNEYRLRCRTVMATMEKLLRSTESGARDAYTDFYLHTFRPLSHKHAELMLKLENYHLNTVAETTSQTERVSTRGQIVSEVALTVGFVAALGLGVFVSYVVSKQLIHHVHQPAAVAVDAEER